MSKQPNFYFRNNKRDLWHDDYKNAKRIMYKRIEVGSIRMDMEGKYKVIFMGNASEEALKRNPNCRWAWKTLTLRFKSQQCAMDFIKANAREFFDVLFDDIKTKHSSSTGKEKLPVEKGA